MAPGAEREFNVFYRAFFFSPGPGWTYFYSVMVCMRTANLSFFIFIPAAHLSTVEANSSEKVETNSSVSRAGNQPAENPAKK